MIIFGSKLYILIFSSLIFIISAVSVSQVSQVWVARYNGPGINIDAPSAMTTDKFGNLYVCGYTSNEPRVYFLTIKYSPAGDTLWTRKFNGRGNRDGAANSIATDAAGNVYAAGYAIDSITVKKNIYMVKFNSSGDTLWTRQFSGPGANDDEATRLILDNYGYIYLSGYSVRTGNFGDFYLLKLTNNGDTVWTRTYRSPDGYDDVIHDMKIDKFRNVYVTGHSGTSSNFEDYITIKYDSSGNQLWLQRFNGTFNLADIPKGMQLDTFGNVFVTGISEQSGRTAAFLTLKYNSSGVQQWTKLYTGPLGLDSYSEAIAINSSGNIFVTGFGGGVFLNYDFITIKYMNDGTESWVRRYNGSADLDDYSNVIAVDISGGIYALGYTHEAGGLDYQTRKLNDAGSLQWNMRYNGTGNGPDYTTCMHVDSAYNVYVSGYSIGAGSGPDITTIKYSQTVGVHSIGSQVPNNFSLSQNYPNPFNPVTNIAFQIPRGGFVQLKVFDVLGREVTVLVNEHLNPGTYEVEWSAEGGASSYPSGVYYYKLAAADFSQTKKMILIK